MLPLCKTSIVVDVQLHDVYRATVKEFTVPSCVLSDDTLSPSSSSSAAAAAMIPSETAPPSMTAVEFDALMLRHLDGVRRRCDEEAEAAAVVSKVQMESEEVTYSSLAF